MAPQTAISKAVCYKTKNEQLWEKAVHFLLVATNCFYAGLPTVFCTITKNRTKSWRRYRKTCAVSSVVVLESSDVAKQMNLSEINMC